MRERNKTSRKCQENIIPRSDSLFLYCHVLMWRLMCLFAPSGLLLLARAMKVKRANGFAYLQKLPSLSTCPASHPTIKSSIQPFNHIAIPPLVSVWSSSFAAFNYSTAKMFNLSSVWAKSDYDFLLANKRLKTQTWPNKRLKTRTWLISWALVLGNVLKNSRGDSVSPTCTLIGWKI